MKDELPTVEQINRALTALSDAMCKLSEANGPISREIGTPHPSVYYKINQAWRLANECWKELEEMRKARSKEPHV